MKPLDMGLFQPFQGLKAYKVASIGCPKQNSPKITKVTYAFSNLLHFTKSTH